MIEEEQEIRKTNYVKIFSKQTKGKTIKKGIKNPSYKNKQGKHHSEKNVQKKKIDKTNSVVSLFFERNLQQVNKETNISTQNEKTAKKGETLKTYGNNEKSRKIKK